MTFLSLNNPISTRLWRRRHANARIMIHNRCSVLMWLVRQPLSPAKSLKVRAQGMLGRDPPIGNHHRNTNPSRLRASHRRRSTLAILCLFPRPLTLRVRTKYRKLGWIRLGGTRFIWVRQHKHEDLLRCESRHTRNRIRSVLGREAIEMNSLINGLATHSYNRDVRTKL